MQALFQYVSCVCESNRVFDNREMKQDTEVEITIVIALNLLKYPKESSIQIADNTLQ